MSRFNFVATRVGLLLFLLIPFLLRQRAGFYEPYPALLLPVGSETVPITSKTITVNREHFVGVRTSGERVQFETVALFAPIESVNSGYIGRRQFGLEQPHSAIVSPVIRRVTDWNGRGRVTPEDRAAVQTFFRERIAQLGYNDVETLIYQQYEVVFDVVERRELTRTLRLEQTIALEEKE